MMAARPAGDLRQIKKSVRARRLQGARRMKEELSLAVLLLGGDEMLLGSLKSWREGASSDEDVLADLRNWNEAKMLEMKEWPPSMSGPDLESARSPPVHGRGRAVPPHTGRHRGDPRRPCFT
jgi:hypothetical protein